MLTHWWWRSKRSITLTSASCFTIVRFLKKVVFNCLSIKLCMLRFLVVNNSNILNRNDNRYGTVSKEEYCSYYCLFKYFIFYWLKYLLLSNHFIDNILIIIPRQIHWSRQIHPCFFFFLSKQKRCCCISESLLKIVNY